jgi:hypothetical protein
MARPVSWLPRLPALARSVSESVKARVKPGHYGRVKQDQSIAVKL